VEGHHPVERKCSVVGVPSMGLQITQAYQNNSYHNTDIALNGGEIAILRSSAVYVSAAPLLAWQPINAKNC
jgi:hypothetical protein